MYKVKSEFELIADYLDESFINLFFSSELVTAETLFLSILCSQCLLFHSQENDKPFQDKGAKEGRCSKYKWKACCQEAKSRGVASP
jgi:spore cortex formation protein SpoVR/YcgB (stage V sporulation)